MDMNLMVMKFYIMEKQEIKLKLKYLLDHVSTKD